MTYPNTQLFINGHWQDAADGKTLSVANPATGKEIGRVAHASHADLDAALAAALLRERAPQIAALMTQEQGKPLGEAKIEVLAGADIIDWFAEEG
ncbi:MAG: aldehyde dehydrogenase family protein, partial [Betaproteobacteria bacterium]|nr:aldehyde dehydrogenase family protein [Betaproteobacteria bacterium]